MKVKMTTKLRNILGNRKDRNILVENIPDNNQQESKTFELSNGKTYVLKRI